MRCCHANACVARLSRFSGLDRFQHSGQATLQPISSGKQLTPIPGGHDPCVPYHRGVTQSRDNAPIAYKTRRFRRFSAHFSTMVSGGKSPRPALTRPLSVTDEANRAAGQSRWRPHAREAVGNCARPANRVAAPQLRVQKSNER